MPDITHNFIAANRVRQQDDNNDVSPDTNHYLCSAVNYRYSNNGNNHL
jgi:hypothetical protein